MLSAVILAYESPRVAPPRVETARREAAARSLASLVEACVRGLIADAVLAGPSGAGLDEVADAAGCVFVETRDPAGGLAQALAAARREHVFVFLAGAAIERGFVDEVRDVFAYGDVSRTMILRAAPDSLVTRLSPNLAAPVGLIAPKRALLSAGGANLAALARALKGADLTTRARRAL